EQMGGCGASSREQMLSGLQSALDGLPGLVVDDPQSLDHTRFPLDSRSPPVDASPGLRTLSPFPAIEVELPHILGVLQHEIDRVRAPRAPRSVQVKVFCDGFLPQAITEQLEDLAHDGRFRWFKHDAVADRDGLAMLITPAQFMDWLRSIAVGSATCRIALQEPPVETALRGLPKVIQVQFVHKALDRDADFCCVISRVDAICDGNHSDAGKSETFDDPVSVPNISGEA